MNDGLAGAIKTSEIAHRTLGKPVRLGVFARYKSVYLPHRKAQSGKPEACSFEPAASDLAPAAGNKMR